VQVTLSGSSMKTDEWPYRKESGEADLYETSTIPADFLHVSDFPSCAATVIPRCSLIPLMTIMCSSLKFSAISDTLSLLWCLLSVSKHRRRFTGLRPNIPQINQRENVRLLA
jgi:hypothetical protein